MLYEKLLNSDLKLDCNPPFFCLYQTASFYVYNRVKLHMYMCAAS